MFNRTPPMSLLGLLAVMMLAVLSGCDPHAEHKKAVHATWTVMKQGYDGSGGQAVVKSLTRESLEHYGRVCKMALDLPELELLKQPPTTMCEVLEARNKSTRKELEKLDGAGFVAHVVNKGSWVGSLEGVEITDVKVVGDFASASLYYPELEKEFRNESMSRAFGGRRSRLFGGSAQKPPRYPVRFVKEADGWKFDELSMLPHWDKELLEAAKMERMNIRAYVEMTLESDDGSDIPKTVWQPMKK